MVIYKVDWTAELNALAPYFVGKGGVVRVTYYGDESAWLRFSATIKERHASEQKPGFSLRLDPDYFTTRTLEDVIHEFERKLSGIGQPVAAPSTAQSILSGNSSGSNMAINITNSTVTSEGVVGPGFRFAKISAVLDALESFLAFGRCMIVVHHHKSEEQNFFWRDFWMDGLEKLVVKGLSLVHFHDRDDGALHGDAPEPTLTLTLPRDLNEEARQAEAYDDLYDVFTAHGMNGDQAAEAANSLLIYGDESVAAVHNGLAKRLLAIAQAESVPL